MDTTPPNRWLRHSLAAAARIVLATLVGLLVWTVLPIILGWQSSVVMSGSMAPAIRTGDVVLTREVPTDQLQPGHVLLVEDPDARGSRVLHRYDHADEDGGLVLRGDANQQEDSAPVAAEDVRGVGVLRVPWVGLPYVWAAEGRYAPVGLTVLAILLLAALSPIREHRVRAPEGDDQGGVDPDRGTPDRTETSLVKARHAVVAATLLLVAGGGAGAASTPADATFSDSISVSAHLTAGTWESEANAIQAPRPEPSEGELADAAVGEVTSEQGAAPTLATLS